MSGRKSSEVNEMLSKAKTTRNSGIEVIKSTLKEESVIIGECKSVQEETKDFFEKTRFSLSTEAQQEFSVEAEQLKDAFARLKARAKITNNTSSKNVFTEIEAEYAECDYEADCIREKIKSKPHYCDPEYRQASDVHRRYVDLKNRCNNLRNTVSKKISQMQVEINNSHIQKAEYEDLLNRKKDLEKKSKDIVAMRAKADLAKKNVNNDFGGIDTAIANKFMKKEFSVLQKSVSDFTSQNDSNVVNNCQKIVSEITSFKNKLQDVYNDFLARQKEAKSLIDSILDRINKPLYSNPEDEFRKLEVKKLSSLADFLKNFGNSQFVNDIENLVNKLKADFKAEKFSDVKKTFESTMQIIDEASNYAATTHENQAKTILNMLTIKKVMLNLNYDVTVTKNSEYGDGYSIECRAGDEIIDFDRVTMTEDGKPVIDIDHTEATKGTCHKPWSTIQKSMAEEGLIIEDIKWHGVSVLNKQANPKAQKTEKNEKATH